MYQDQDSGVWNTTRREERWIDERSRELAAESFDHAHDYGDGPSVTAVIHAAIHAEREGFGHASRRALIDAIEALRTQYVEQRAESFADEAADELNQWEPEEA